MNKFYFFYIAATALFSCTSAKEDGTTEILPEILVTTAEVKDTILRTPYVATLQAVQYTEIRSRVHGFLEQILIDEGKPVIKGQPLFRLSTGELLINQSKAQANLNIAIAEAKTVALEVERVKVLVEKKVITQTELDLVKAKLKGAEARVSEANAILAEADLKLSYATIRAPFNGSATRLPLKTGSLIEEGTMLTSISDIQSAFAYFSVSENEYLQFTKMKKTIGNQLDSVKLVLSDGSDYRYAGAIETMNGEIDPSTGSIAFRARFPNPQGLLKHGATGKVIMETSINSTLLIPQKAVFEIQDRNFVFWVDESNTVHQRAFDPIRRLGQYYLVKAGLQEGDRIVYEGVQNLREGNKIIPKMITADRLQHN